MSLYMPTGSMPEWSYWFYGVLGLIIFWWSWSTMRYKHANGTTDYFWENTFGILIGLFLVYYWLNKIGIVPMYPWLIDQWFYGWK